jgi:hypothetical protein
MERRMIQNSTPIPPSRMAYRTKGALDPVVLDPAPDDDGSTLSVSANEKHAKM